MTTELTPEQIAMFKNVVRDPVLFASHVLGVDLWPREVEILRSIKNHRRTAIKACHGVGKTFTLAVAALWWLARYPEGIVLTTSSTQRQVRTQLWSEIHRLVKGAKDSLPETQDHRAQVPRREQFRDRLLDQPVRKLSGVSRKVCLDHRRRGARDRVGDLGRGGWNNGRRRGSYRDGRQSDRPSGAFFDAFTKDRGLWKCFTIGAFDSPNLKGITLEQLLEMDPAEGGPLDQNPIPYLVAKRWVYDQYQSWWHGDEASSPNWMSRVLARISGSSRGRPVQDDLAREGQAARDRNPDSNVPTNLPLFAGVDVGGGHCGNRHLRLRVQGRPHQDHRIGRMAGTGYSWAGG